MTQNALESRLGRLVAQRHQCEDELGAAQKTIPSAREQLVAHDQCARIARANALTTAAVSVPRQLVQKDDERQRAPRRVAPVTKTATFSLVEENTELLPYLRVQCCLCWRPGGHKPARVIQRIRIACKPEGKYPLGFCQRAAALEGRLASPNGSRPWGST